MNTVLIQNDHSVRAKQYTKSPTTKHALKEEILMKTISFNDFAKRSSFSTGQWPNDAKLRLFMTSKGTWLVLTSVNAYAIRDIAINGCEDEDGKSQHIDGINFIVIC